LKQHPELKDTLDDLFGQNSNQRLGPASDEADLGIDSAYVATGQDRREMAWQLIKKRRGQPEFRNALLQRYEGHCLVTGCKVADILEAAHIDPYRGEGSNHPGNGLLLRADIHTLFDLDLLGIEPDSLEVEVHPGIAKEYGKLAGNTLCCVPNRRPSKEALKRRYQLFQKQQQEPI
jgi:predicted restriction endonuclease